MSLPVFGCLEKILYICGAVRQVCPAPPYFLYRMRKLRCVIVDDELLAVKLLEGFVGRTPFLELAGSYLSATEALGAVGGDVDVLFLDINMPELNGLELARLVSPPTRVVFTTAYREYALESYAVHAADYLLKPLSYPKFLEAAKRLAEGQAGQPAEQPADDDGTARDYLFVKCENRMVRVDLPGVLYVKGLKDYVCIYTEDSPRALIALTTLKAIEERLPSSRFCRVHKSYIVNVGKVCAVERGKVYVGSECITLTDAYKERFLSLLRL